MALIDDILNFGSSSSPDTSSTIQFGTVPQASGVLGSAGSASVAPNLGLGWNVGTGQLALSGLGALGNVWSASQSNKLANQQFNYTKKITDTNLNNSIQSYNTALEDRIRARAKTQGMSDDEVNSYLASNKLSR